MRSQRGRILRKHPFIIAYSMILLMMILIQGIFHPFPSLNFSKVNMAGDSATKLKPDEKRYKELYQDRSTATYFVAGGDTFESVAEKLGVPVKTITKLNPGIEPGTQIKPGTKIKVPVVP